MPREQPGFFEELKRRHVVRAALIYVAAVWALAQGISQLSPVFGLSEKVTLWFVIACVIGFPFWLAFAWYFKFTPHGLAREDESAQDVDAVRRTGRVLDYWIIGILAVAVVLLLTNQLVLQRGRTIREFTATASVPTAHITVKTATVAEPPVAVIPSKSVAVLPFANESGQKNQQYFSDGLSEDLITALSQFAGLKVISRNSAFQFRNSKDSSAEIGRELGVAHLLEGSVQRAGDEVRITASLVDAANGSVLWSRRYDKPYKDLFALQDAITKAVATALKAKLLATPGAVVQSDRPPSGNLAAYAAYLQGMADLTGGVPQAYLDAKAEFEKAVRLDPRYALADARLAEWWGGQYSGGHTTTTGPQEIAHARAAIRAALTLNPDLAAAHRIHGYLLDRLNFDWYGAEAAYRRALQLAPNDPEAKEGLAAESAVLGQNRAAIDLLRAVLELDPRDGEGWLLLGRVLTAVGQLDAAEQAIRKGIALLPPGWPWSYERLAVIAVLRGNAQQAMALARKESNAFWRNFGITIAAQIGSNRTAAASTLQNLIAQDGDTSAFQVASVYALRGDPDDMFHWLNRAWADRDDGVGLLLSDPFILRYRHDPRFAAFCRKVGLPATTDAVAMK